MTTFSATQREHARKLDEQRRIDKKAALLAEKRFYLQSNPIHVPEDRDLRKLNEQETLSDKANYTLLFQIIDAINSDEFSAVRAKLPTEEGWR